MDCEISVSVSQAFQGPYSMGQVDVLNFQVVVIDHAFNTELKYTQVYAYT